jgi:hypothetical protein
MGFIPEWAIGVAFVMVAISVARALSRMLRAPGRAVPSSDNEVGELRQTMDAMQTRLAELEERLDFTERLLAKHREADRLGSPPR